jgi:putative inorganic carbon (hco3(-)) transporter
MSNRLKYPVLSKDRRNIIYAIIVSLAFLIASLLMIENSGRFLWCIPPVLIAIAFALIAIDKFLLFTVFLVPVSVQLRFLIPETSADLFLPTELMLAGILILMICKLIIWKEIDRRILVHPVSVISFCMLGWYLVTSFSSTLPVVSLKSFITKIWFFAGFYLLAAQIFSKEETIKKYFYAYIAGMTPVVFYYLTRMWQAGIFNQKMAYGSVRPFFNDHTSFGAALAFCIPVLFWFLISKKRSMPARIGFSLLLLVFTTALVFSYSRAAWLSLIAAAAVSLFLILKMSWKIALPAILITAVIIFFSLSDIMIRMKENRQDSSDNMKQHLQSISNIRSDASNVERLNRWNCAVRMFREKPFLGWGPATYQFNYAPFQVASEKTIISTNYGGGGNAHSEYLGSLVDSGLPGLLLYVLLLIISIYRGVIIWKNHCEKHIRYLSLALVAGLVTYVVHGALNNFLDTDKVSALFWGMIAAIVASDVGLKKGIDDKGSPEVGGNN